MSVLNEQYGSAPSFPTTGAAARAAVAAETRVVVTILVCPNWRTFVRTLASWALLRYQARGVPGFIDAWLLIRYWRRTIVMFSAWENLHAVRSYAADTKTHLGAIRWIKHEHALVWSRTFAVEQTSFASRDVVWTSHGLRKLHSA
jgi:hypothetical protein